jgi:hypothetical protein
MHSRRSRASFGLMSQSASVCNTALVLATECSGTVASRVTVRLRLRSIDRWRAVACMDHTYRLSFWLLPLVSAPPGRGPEAL